MSAWTPHAKYRHVFVVIRLDEYQGLNVPLEDQIMVTKVFSNQEAAELETERLNRLNSGKQCRYLWRVGRLVDQPAERTG